MKKLLNNKKVFIGVTIFYVALALIFAIYAENAIHFPFELCRFIAVFIGFSLIASIFVSIFRDGFKNNIVKLLKMVFSIILIIYVTYIYQKINILLFGMIELGLIMYLTNILVRKNKIVGNIIGNIMYFAYNANLCVYLFGASYISLIMLTNIGSLDELSGNASNYALGAITIVVFSILFYRKTNPYYKKEFLIFILSLLIFLGSLFFDKNAFYMENAPIGNYFSLIGDFNSYYEIKKIKNTKNLDKNKFYQSEIKDYYKKDSKLPENPNIIVIFVEGFSNDIIYDEREIMPNVKKFGEKSLKFENYYNHMSATYRGIIGQLFSGFQLDNTDPNYLISMEEILNNEGYHTVFLNVEPNSSLYSNYLKELRFNEILNIPGNPDSSAYSYSDKKALEGLYDKAIELNQEDEPFFLSIYTLGTHVSLDSVYKKFGYGDSNVLNRFYDLDYQFGNFINKFNKSELADNTIIIFTTDHASYVDKDYNYAFPEHGRQHNFFDQIPLFIYYKGIKPKVIDADYRTSLDFAPTILDYLDISAENYFLGDSLFGEVNNKYDGYFYDGSTFMKVDEGRILRLNNMAIESIYQYFSVATEKKNKKDFTLEKKKLYNIEPSSDI